MNKERFDKGTAVRRKVMGAERVDNIMRNMDEITRPIHELIAEYCRGGNLDAPRVAQEDEKPD